jgi:hypothetical protein
MRLLTGTDVEEKRGGDMRLRVMKDYDTTEEQYQ